MEWKKTKIVFKVVHHKQDSSQQLVGHQQMVDVRTSMILTAVTGTPSHKWIKVLLVLFFSFRLISNDVISWLQLVVLIFFV